MEKKFLVAGPLCGEFAGDRWIPRIKASDTELWCFLWPATEKNVWVNNGAAGDLTRHHAHDDAIDMVLSIYNDMCNVYLQHGFVKFYQG